MLKKKSTRPSKNQKEKATELNNLLIIQILKLWDTILISTAKTGKFSFFSVKEKAWHGLGQIVTDYPTSREAIQYAGLDYNVVKSPLFTLGSDFVDDANGVRVVENEIYVPDYYATMRTDNNTVLGVVGKDYHIVQNEDAFAFFDAIVGGGKGIKYETAGALGKGERIFITAKLPDYIRVGNGDDVVEKYIFLTTSHDGSGSITAAFTPIRIVCQNTLNASLKSMTNVVRIKHTSGANERLSNAHKVMGLAEKMSQNLENTFNHWAKVKITDSQVRKLIQMALCPNKETLELIHNGQQEEFSTIFKNTVNDAFAYAMFNDSQKMETTKGTVFGAYNAITGYFQNVRNYKNQEAKLKSIVMGGTAQMKSQKAFELCTAFEKEGNLIFS